MTDEELKFHVACIVFAARHCRIGLLEIKGSDGHYFYWKDQFGGVVAGIEHPDRKQALKLACDKLADTFELKPNERTQAKYKI